MGFLVELHSTAEIVIMGGGVMGASTAYNLAALGVKDIVLLEKEQFLGQGATGRCAGGVRYQFGTEINIKLSLASLRMLDRFKDELGQDIEYRKCGYLFVLTKEKDVIAFERTSPFSISSASRLNGCMAMRFGRDCP